jgi:site-specific recombinase XerD
VFAKIPSSLQIGIHQYRKSPHVLRHTFSVTAVQKGISLPALQRLLGHDHLATTEIYLNLSPDRRPEREGEAIRP